MNKPSRRILLLLAGLILSIVFSGYATMAKAGTSAKLVAAPTKTVLSPALIKKPITFHGSGWKPEEMVVINLIIPPGVSVKGVKKGEDVGIAWANADAEGILKAKVGPLALLMTFFQVGWDDKKMKPDFKKATPLPAGEYTVQAIGLGSELKANTILTLLAPPKKKK